jgi:ubiquitin carboxyl-terminal hydrolase 4/11/15
LKDINFRNPLGSEGKLACAYGEFLKELFFTNRRAIEPRTLKKIVEKKNSTFSGYEQQDSQEFLSYFLDLVHEDLNRVKEKPHV